MAAVSRLSNPERVVITAVLAGVLDMTPGAILNAELRGRPLADGPA